MQDLLSLALVCSELAGAEEATAVGAADVLELPEPEELPEEPVAPNVVPLVQSEPMTTVTSE